MSEINAQRVLEILEELRAEGIIGETYMSRLNTLDSKWWAVGLFKTDRMGEGRAVLELLRHAVFDGLIVRVYREQPTQVVYSLRVRTNSTVEGVIREASEVFAALPGEYSVEDYGLADLGPDIREALNPLPPPVQVEQIPER